ncbi:hypothetical protein Sgly_1145 [Syntrophobotulus glycolicus DSM 8271]|uniref:Uncharacterized protein n=1 Tax=Syntrophobotulus glycolicus (strain DSM 8271 / FlGlyR) TaxID=645991 RepID=F0SU84_SYNGF|nr:hypothetical protein [Syntrophobotulus glycolicus]ADY55467.1 hypothetical protein Sgly_1145 [Syntrophobotulus glycolicus DSM 8271]
MRIAGLSHFYVPTINNRLDLSSLEQAEVYAPKQSPEKNVYTYSGGFGIYCYRSPEETLFMIKNCITAETMSTTRKLIALPNDKIPAPPDPTIDTQI